METEEKLKNNLNDNALFLMHQKGKDFILNSLLYSNLYWVNDIVKDFQIELKNLEGKECECEDCIDLEGLAYGIDCFEKRRQEHSLIEEYMQKLREYLY